jgi:farnesyl diphosphate synthase
MTENHSIQKYKLRADNAIEIALSYFEGNSVSFKLFEAVKYSLLNGGKRVRAALVYAVGDAFNVPSKTLDKAAVALEMIHAYSLIHDDLPAMDNDELRRGKPTCHIAFDEATAILAGDALQSMAYEYLLLVDEIDPKQVIKALKLLSTNAGFNGMVAGQMLDIAAENSCINMDELEKIHRHKTGDLLCASVLIGLYLSESYENTSYINSLTTFAENIGLAFQIQDDVLDVTATTEELGKIAGHDESSNKQTYPSLLGVPESQALLKTYFNVSMLALNEIPVNLSKLKEIASFIVNRNC